MLVRSSRSRRTSVPGKRGEKAQGHLAKKRPQVVEYHHDDCGEDFSPLGDDLFAQEVFGDFSEIVDDSEDEA